MAIIYTYPREVNEANPTQKEIDAKPYEPKHEDYRPSQDRGPGVR